MNNFLLFVCAQAKWAAQAMLAGADQLKLGYVSRVNPTNNAAHEILATHFFKPKELAQQINLSVHNMWGIIKMISELLMRKEDGKYVLLKDPNKATVRLYAVPLNTFESDGEQDGEGDGEGEGLGGGDDEDEEDVSFYRTGAYTYHN